MLSRKNIIHDITNTTQHIIRQTNTGLHFLCALYFRVVVRHALSRPLSLLHKSTRNTRMLPSYKRAGWTVAPQAAVKTDLSDSVLGLCQVSMDGNWS